MIMIKEAFVSEQTKKLLEEKGFPFASLNRNGKRNGNWCTQQMAMRWLREVHNIHIIAEPCLGEGNEPNLSFNRWFWTILKEEGEYKPIRKIDEFPTYEEACEAAIKYCIENLIK